MMIEPDPDKPSGCERDEAGEEATRYGNELLSLSAKHHLLEEERDLQKGRIYRLECEAAELEDKLREEAEMKPHYAAMEYDRKRLAAELKKAKEHLEGVQSAFKSAQSQRNELHAELEQEQNLSALNLENNDRLRVQLDQSKREAAAMREALQALLNRLNTPAFLRYDTIWLRAHLESALSSNGQDFIPRADYDAMKRERDEQCRLKHNCIGELERLRGDLAQATAQVAASRPKVA